MAWLDGSKAAALSWEAQNNPSSRKSRPVPLISITLQRDDGVGLSFGNLGLADYQLVFGFADVMSPSASRAFAERVTSRLEKRWPVKRIDGEKFGVMPDPNCN